MELWFGNRRNNDWNGFWRKQGVFDSLQGRIQYLLPLLSVYHTGLLVSQIPHLDEHGYFGLHSVVHALEGGQIEDGDCRFADALDKPFISTFQSIYAHATSNSWRRTGDFRRRVVM